jgi:hygromycin-B 7''-O-kinase
MSGLLPPPEAVDRLRHRAATWMPAAAHIAARHGGGDLRLVAEGSNVVFALGEDRFLKLFAPQFRAEREAEQVALETARARLSVAVPALLAEGSLEGWPYLVLGRVEGVPARHRWAELPRRARMRALERLGALVAELRALDPAGLPADWESYAAMLRRTAVDRQRRLGAHPGLLAELPALLARPPAPEPPVFLHADLTDENVLLDGDGRVCAVIDFGDARSGPAAYELVTPLMQLAGPDAALAGALLRGAGARPDPEVLLHHTALHHYNDLSRFRGHSLRELVACWC